MTGNAAWMRREMEAEDFSLTEKGPASTRRSTTVPRKTVREQVTVWRGYRNRIRGILASARVDAVSTLAVSLADARRRRDEARRELQARYGMRVTLGGDGAPRLDWAEDVKARLIPNASPSEILRLQDAVWRYVAHERALRAASAALEVSRRHGEDRARGARAACAAIVWVLRTSPEQRGAFAFGPEQPGRAPEVLQGRDPEAVAKALASAEAQIGATREQSLNDVSGWARSGIRRYPRLAAEVEASGESFQEVVERELRSAVLRQSRACREEPAGRRKSLVTRVMHDILQGVRRPGDVDLEDPAVERAVGYAELEDWRMREDLLRNLDEMRGWVEAALPLFSPQERRTFDLDIATNFDLQQVAHEMGITLGTAKTYRYRYMGKIRQVAGL